MKLFLVNFMEKDDAPDGVNGDVSYLVRAEDYEQAATLAEANFRLVKERFPHTDSLASFSCDLGEAYGDTPPCVMNAYPIQDMVSLAEGCQEYCIIYRRDLDWSEPCWNNDNETKKMMWGAFKEELGIDSKKKYL